MNFLNEVAANFPKAISFASGRPADAFFDLEGWLRKVPDFLRYFSEKNSVCPDTASNILPQYGRTNGIISDLISHQVANDEGIDCQAGQIVITAGCQEAISLCVTALCSHENDVVLARSPTYIGITGVCDLNGIEISPFNYEETGDILHTLRAATTALHLRGKRPRVLYLVPDFDNPTGGVLSRAERESIIAFCAEKEIAILEDNPYGLFRYEGSHLPRMHSLDTRGCVIYLGTYSKTICPSLRVGFVVVPKHLFGNPKRSSALIDELSKAKSFVTVNTSQISQAIVGGILLSENGTLSNVVAPVIEFYRRNRDTMLKCLEECFHADDGLVTWNKPAGGFFLTVSLPFKFRQEEAEICARDYDVLVMPLSFFALDNTQDYHVRMAFSNVQPGDIAEGISRFAGFVKSRCSTI